MTTNAKDEKYLGRDIPAIPFEVSKSEENYLINEKGEKYLDFVMGWCVGNMGWGNKIIEKKIRSFVGPTYVMPDYLYKPWTDLAELLAKITPGELTKSYRTTGGTEAIECALQAAMSYTKRSKFLSIKDSYHGHSIGAMSIGLSDFRERYSNLLPNCKKISPPLDEKAGKKVELILSKSDIAAYISEPIICNLGVEIPTQEYFNIVKDACKKYGTLLIIDEVATGFGRTGKLFASEYYNLEPDILCLAKGITSGYGALGATVMTETVSNAMKFPFSFYSTFAWQPINVEAALANLLYLMENKDTVLKNTNKISSVFEKRLKDMNFKSQAKLRIKGLAIGIKFKTRDYSYEIMHKAFQNKLLVSAQDPFSIVIFPSLNIDEEIANIGLDILEDSL